jgi:bile acid-coenzyme A ligase
MWSLDDILDTDGAPIPGAPLGALLTAQAERDPNRPALTVANVTLSRTQFDAAANQRARQLTALGVGKDDVVVLALPNGKEFYECAYGLIKVGATVCHVSHRLTDVESRQIVELAAPRLIIGDIPAPPKIRRLPAGAGPDPRLSTEPVLGHVAKQWKIGTSGGSTGRPKLIVDPNPAIWGPDKEGRRRLPGATIINPAPLFHSAPFNNMVLALVQGSHVIDMGRFDAETYLSLVSRYRADWAYLVPTMMSRICKLPADVRDRYDISSLKTVVHMAAMCPTAVKQAWIDWIGPDAVWEVYGGAERFGLTIISGNEWLKHRGSVGKPIPGSEVAVFDDNGEPCAPGLVGEIHFRAALGPCSTYTLIGAEARVRGGWESYGDLGWLDEDGYLYIADRRTDMIVSGGANVYPAEIEAALDLIPEVIAGVVIGLPDNDLGQRVHAIVELDPAMPSAPSETEILAFLATRLAPYKLPRTIEFTAEPLRDDAGKVRRSALRAARLVYD